jgi:polyferredoxin
MTARRDLLRLPLIGALLRHRHGRLFFQVIFFGGALVLVIDGFTGDQLAPLNLATIVPWVHMRGALVIALLLAGNLFCMACPFALPRTLAKRLSLSGRRFPRALRGKWIAIASLIALFFLYEWLNFWSSPLLTAWLIVAYFAAAFALEAWFTESAFCKYVCPLGAFNFTYAAVSPTQIGVHDPQVCRTCVGKECINGSYAPTNVILIDRIGTDGAPEAVHAHTPQGTPGCGTLLFAPQITSNADCTLCLDCARACPHDNIGLFTRAPGAEIARPEAAPRRWDAALLITVLAALGLVNAFGMVPPVYPLLQAIGAATGLARVGVPDRAIEGVALAVVFAVGIGALVLLTLAAAALTRWLVRAAQPLRAVYGAFVPALIPISFGIWGAHYAFHFLIGWFDPALVGLVQVLALLGGFIGSLWAGQAIAGRRFGRRAPLALLPWALVMLAMIGCAWWLFTLPMEMRGTILFS